MYNLHVNTRYELVNINVYLANNAFLKYNIYNNAFELQDCQWLNKVCDL